jgi:hypothetical protein
MIASLCLLSVRHSAEQCLAVSCTWVLTWEQVGIDNVIVAFGGVGAGGAFRIESRGSSMEGFASWELPET